MAQILAPNAELAAFVEESRRDRPMAWEAVQRLQRACRAVQPSTPEGSFHAIDVLRRIDLVPAAPDSGGSGRLVETLQGH